MKYIAIALINSIIIMCFTFLALSFDRWWIVFFAFIFFMSERNEKNE